MATHLSIDRYGEHAWMVTSKSHKPAILAQTLIERFDGDNCLLSQFIEEVVPGAQSVLIVASRTAPLAELETRLTALLTKLDPASATQSQQAEVSLEVNYNGSDLPLLATQLNLSPQAIVELHTQATYEVAFCGFSPGFAYLTGLPTELHVPRLSTPRPQVPAGSVAIADSYSAVYPQASPGGWHLLGRTQATLFNLNEPEPALLQPGTKVRFVQIRESAVAKPPPPNKSKTTPAAPHLEEDFAITIESPGTQTLIQDLGRHGFRPLGVSWAGAFDSRAAQQANTLVGNPIGSALLETLMGNLRFRTHQPITMALTGAPLTALVTTASGSFEPAMRSRIDVPTNATVELGTPKTGMRTYIAFAGGIDIDEALGSRSRDTLGELGPEPLAAGQHFRLLAAEPSPPTNDQPPSKKPDLLPDITTANPTALGATDLASVDLVAALAATKRQDDTVPVLSARATMHAIVIQGDLAALLRKRTWTVDDRSSRIGIRISSEPLPVDIPSAWESEPTLPGSIQVAPNGELIIFGPDGPTTGGYPVIAVANAEALNTLSQLRPGSQLRIEINE